MTDLAGLINVADFERAARRRLPRMIWDVIAGGGGDEVTLRRNRAALDAVALRPRALVDVRQRDIGVDVFGQRVALPVLLAPTGFNRMAHRDAEIGAGLGAASAGTIFTLGTVSTYTPDEVAERCSGPLWFQLYVRPSREETDLLLARVDPSRYSALVVTIDTAMTGIRERDARNGMTVPLRITPRLIAQAATRPAWALDFLRGGVGRGGQGYGETRRHVRRVGELIRSSARQVTEDDMRWLRSRWKGPLLVKGVLRGDDCERLLQLGIDGIVVSNHGGRQLDSVPATIDALPEVVQAVAGRAEVFVDGGFRRGVDVVKALALGARAVLIGRPYVYGLAVGGQRGVERVLDIFAAEISHTFALLGCTRVSELDPSFVAMERVLVPGSGPSRAREHV
jgi:isopentenyl diphosphate isomerase/L-lactate dehydrogenase-like FMN-dependent dehydrogenase